MTTVTSLRHVTLLPMARILARATQDVDNFGLNFFKLKPLIEYCVIIFSLKKENITRHRTCFNALNSMH